MESSPSYEKLRASMDTLADLDCQTEERDPLRSSNTRKVWYRSLTVRLVTLAGCAALIGFTFLGLCITILQRHHGESNPGSTAGIIHCGESAAEARALGCTFDVMLQLWVQPECYDEEMSEDFLARGQWKWYSDVHARHEMSDNEMRLGEAPVAFMVDDYHRQHCVFTWQMMVKALRGQKMLIEEMMSYEHVMHCHHMLLNPPFNETAMHTPMGVEAHLGYARCAPYEVWKDNLPPDNLLKDVY